MPSEVMDQRRLSLLYTNSVPPSFSDEIRFPAERRVGFRKPDLGADNFASCSAGMEEVPVIVGNKTVSSPLQKKLQLARLNSAKGLESHQTNFLKESTANFSLEHLMESERRIGLPNTPWKPMNHDLGSRSNLLVQSATSYSMENKVDLNALHYENGLFSSSLSELFNRKVTLPQDHAPFGQLFDSVNSNFEEDEPFESLKEMEAQTIGNLLPDDDDLLDYIAQQNSSDDVEDDIFCRVGGMEIEEIDSSYHKKGSEVADGTSNGQRDQVNTSFAGEHPYGEHPSRTVFVRNISSNVEDAELRELFEDNPSEKDNNQGTLVVFNPESTVSNEELRRIFGVYGDIKEIRETSQKHHYKFIEFYDVRAAEAALHALNSSDIAGKRIKLESSCPGGARRLMPQIIPELEQDEVGGFHRRKSPPRNSPPGGYGSIPIGTSMPNGLEYRAVQGLHTVNQAPISSFGDNTFNVVPSNVPHVFSPIRPTLGSHSNQSGITELSHSLGQRNFGFQCMPKFHPHSLPEHHNHIHKGIPYNSPDSISAMAMNIARSTGVDNRHIAIGSSGFDSQNFEHSERAFGASANGNYPLHGQQQYVWGNSSSFHSPSGPTMWPNSPSFVNNIACHPSPQMHGLQRTPHMLNTVAPCNHVGSAPTVNPSLWDRRHAYVGESTDVSAFHPGSLGSMGFPGSPVLNQIGLASRDILPHIGGNFVETSLSSLHVGLPSPQQRGHIFHGLNGIISMPASFEAPNDRVRSRRNDASSNQADNKKQYELDIERILCGEDNRTTLMIKNIPNKYTSKMLLAAIDEHHRGTYDFIYLPIDFKNKCNVGYAFINMIDPQKIIPFHKAFNGKKWEKFNSEKVASLAYARIQGKAALIAHFQNSSLMNEDKRCRPILFHSDGPNAGDQEPFPMGVNIRSRPGRPRNHNNEDHHQDSPINSTTEEDSSNGITSLPGSTKDSD